MPGGRRPGRGATATPCPRRCCHPAGNWSCSAAPRALGAPAQRRHRARPERAGLAYLDARLARLRWARPTRWRGGLLTAVLSGPFPITTAGPGCRRLGRAARVRVRRGGHRGAGRDARGARGCHTDVRRGADRLRRAPRCYLPPWFPSPSGCVRCWPRPPTRPGRGGRGAGAYRAGWLPSTGRRPRSWCPTDSTGSPPMRRRRAPPATSPGCSVAPRTPREQVRAVADAGRLRRGRRDRRCSPPWSPGSGPPIAPVLDDWLDWSAQAPMPSSGCSPRCPWCPPTRRSACCSGTSTGSTRTPRVMDAAARFPDRALRLLAGLHRPYGGRAAARPRAHQPANRRDGPCRPCPRRRPAGCGRSSTARRRRSSRRRRRCRRSWPTRRGRGSASAAKPVVVTGLAAEPEAAMAWEPGERDAFLARKAEITDLSGQKSPGPTLAAAEFDRPGTGWRELPIMVHAPDEVTRPRARRLDAAHHVGAGGGRARARRPVRTRRAAGACCTWPATVTGTSCRRCCRTRPVRWRLIVADWYARLKSVRAVAAAWLTRHPAVAARALVPAALGKAGAARRQAEGALRLIAASGHRRRGRARPRPHTAQATVDAISALLDADPLDALPAKLPAVPAWADPALLPQVLLRDGAGRCRADAVRHLFTMLAMSTDRRTVRGRRPGRRRVRPGVARRVRLGGCSSGGRQPGCPATDGWVLQRARPARRRRDGAAARPGDPGLAGRGRARRAVAGLDVLAAIGTDVALMHLHGIAQKVKFKGAAGTGAGEDRRGRRRARPDRRAAGRPAGARLRAGRRRQPGARLRAAAVHRSGSTSSSSRTWPTRTASAARRCPSPARRTTPSWRRPPTSGSRR